MRVCYPGSFIAHVQGSCFDCHNGTVAPGKNTAHLNTSTISAEDDGDNYNAGFRVQYDFGDEQQWVSYVAFDRCQFENYTTTTRYFGFKYGF